ncbi:MAG: chromosomal replication initiator protein DnaA [Acidobacteriota bacterium]
MENVRPHTLSTPGLWDRVRGEIEGRIPRGSFQTWFAPTTQRGVSAGVLEVEVPNEMFAEWMRTQYAPLIREILADHRGGVSDVRFVSRSRAPAPRNEASAAARPARPSLNERYTFENFVVSSCNQFAHAAALAVSEQPGSNYNPLFIYGGVGLGKTHLLQAIGNRLIRARPDIRVVYETSEAFMNELIGAIRYEETGAFRERYRSVDVLLIDDVQFLAGKERTQEEFFHTFNALHQAGRQIVITSDSPPRAIPALEQRLRTRFEWGLIADLSPPDLETKVAILNKMAASEGWALPSEVALFIAGQIDSNVRELEGCLKTLIASASLLHRRPDLDLARQVVRTVAPDEGHHVGIDAIARCVAREFDLRVSELKSKTNQRRIAFPRQVAMYLAKRLAGESYPTIAKYFGGKHHTTALHAFRKIERERRTDRELDGRLTALEEQLR